ncbi:MAG: NAD(P)H-dependent oxidoreductase [Kiloniellales bacterium]|nr:NAD(P)H-dependent oxidoreductase [Kiloniellales bacterium]
MASNDGIRVFGFAGSLRRGSLNKALLAAAQDLAPDGMAIEVFDLAGVPLYDEDLRQAGLPEAVAALRAGIAAADAVLIATPEYNFSFSGVVKNAIDWASRPPDQPFAGKPIAILGASPSRLGTARAQYQLRQCFIYLDGRIMNRPEMMLGDARRAFDEAGRLAEPKAREHLAAFLAALADFTREGRRP